MWSKRSRKTAFKANGRDSNDIEVGNQRMFTAILRRLQVAETHSNSLKNREMK